jgi:hypothetical protein
MKTSKKQMGGMVQSMPTTNHTRHKGPRKHYCHLYISSARRRTAAGDCPVRPPSPTSEPADWRQSALCDGGDWGAVAGV